MKDNRVKDITKQFDKVKPLTEPKTIEEYAELKERQRILLDKSFKNDNENWFERSIIRLWSNKKYRFNRQYLFKRRIFDFFNEHTGCAVEIDGPEHDAKYDLYRDLSVYVYDAIVVFRLRNRNEQDLKDCIGKIMGLESWEARKVQLKISRSVSNHMKIPKRVREKISKAKKKKKQPFYKPIHTHKNESGIRSLKRRLDNE